MKTARCILVLCLLAMLASQVCADQYDYALYYSSAGAVDAGGTKWTFVSGPGASDGFDGELLRTWPSPTPTVYVAKYNTDGASGWNSTSGFYATDNRSPLENGQTATIDNIYLWADTGVESQDLHLYMRGEPGLSPGLTYKLLLVSLPNGIQYNGLREWDVNHSTIVLPFYSTDDGRTGYQFRAVITAPAVPEPSSILALAGGLVGAMGLSLRRRR